MQVRFLSGALEAEISLGFFLFLGGNVEIRREFEDEDDAFDYLIRTGSLYPELIGGEVIYKVNDKLCPEYAPWYYEQHIKGMTETVLHLVDMGFVEIDYDPDTLETTYLITPEGQDFFAALETD